MLELIRYPGKFLFGKRHYRGGSGVGSDLCSIDNSPWQWHFEGFGDGRFTENVSAKYL
jgi:hypothetical protein